MLKKLVSMLIGAQESRHLTGFERVFISTVPCKDDAPIEEKSSLNIAVVCTPHSGHMLPCLHICTELVKRGHHVKVLTADYGAALLVQSMENAAFMRFFGYHDS